MISKFRGRSVAGGGEVKVGFSKQVETQDLEKSISPWAFSAPRPTAGPGEGDGLIKGSPL